MNEKYTYQLSMMCESDNGDSICHHVYITHNNHFTKEEFNDICNSFLQSEQFEEAGEELSDITLVNYLEEAYDFSLVKPEQQFIFSYLK